MKRVLTAAVVPLVFVCALAPAAWADVAYDTFSANFGYEILAGSNVTGQTSAPGYTDTANRFVAQAGGPVSDIWVPVAIVTASANVFEVQLMSDSQNSPGAVLETWTVTNQAFPFDGVYHNPIRLSVASSTVLQQGTPYWLNLHSVPDDGHFVWMFTRPPRFETVAQRFVAGGPWNVLNPGFTSAYRVDVVPEPHSAACGVALSLLVVRRRDRART